MHVRGPRARFPFARKASATPADAPKEWLFALHAALGIERCVVVQSAWHGFDNWVTLDAIAPKDGAYRGIALVPANVDTIGLKRLDALGFCGVRFKFTKRRGAAPSIDAVLRARRAARRPRLASADPDRERADRRDRPAPEALAGSGGPSEAQRQALLVANPQRLYRFPEPQPARRYS